MTRYLITMGLLAGLVGVVILVTMPGGQVVKIGVAGDREAPVGVLLVMFAATGALVSAGLARAMRSSQSARPGAGAWRGARALVQGIVGLLPPTRITLISSALTVAMIIAVAMGQIMIPRAILLMVLAVATILAIERALDGLKDSGFEIRSSWGGLGGGLGGWSVSPPVILVVLALAFIGAATATVIAPIMREHRPITPTPGEPSSQPAGKPPRQAQP